MAAAAAGRDDDGFTTFFSNFVTIVVLMFAWLIVVLAFFILAVQLFITILEFKLTTLAGFVLVPFALWGKTAFLAERVLGNVISSGIKVMVLAVIVGIGSTFFSQFTSPPCRAISRACPRPCRWCWHRCRCSAWASSVPASPPAWFPARRNSARAPPSVQPARWSVPVRWAVPPPWVARAWPARPEWARSGPERLWVQALRRPIRWHRPPPAKVELPESLQGWPVSRVPVLVPSAMPP